MFFPVDSDVDEVSYPRIVVPVISPADAEGGAHRPDAAFSHTYRSRHVTSLLDD